MWTVLGAAVDLVHALAMAGWLLGMPLLFVHRWRALRLGYAVYAVFFIVVSQVSMLLGGECVLTTLARWCVEHDTVQRPDHEWFTERIAHAVFGLAPSHRLVSWVSEALILGSALLVLRSVVYSHRSGALAPAHS